MGSRGSGSGWVGAVGRCVVRANELVLRGRIRQPGDHVGLGFSFADGTTSRVYRETVVERPAPTRPVVLVVGFRLRLVRGEWAHAAFRAESVLNTVLFVGFPGFVSKLWLRHDERGVYRGLYEWDEARLAEDYVAALRHVLGLVSVPGSIDHRVLPGVARAELLQDPQAATVGADADQAPGWWRPMAIVASTG